MFARAVAICSIAGSTNTFALKTPNGNNAAANVTLAPGKSTFASSRVIRDKKASAFFRHGLESNDPRTLTVPSLCLVKRARTGRVACDPDNE